MHCHMDRLRSVPFRCHVSVFVRSSSLSSSLLSPSWPFLQPSSSPFSSLTCSSMAYMNKIHSASPKGQTNKRGPPSLSRPSDNRSTRAHTPLNAQLLCVDDEGQKVRSYVPIPGRYPTWYPFRGALWPDPHTSSFSPSFCLTFFATSRTFWTILKHLAL